MSAALALLLAAPALAETIVVPASLPPALAAACPDCDTVLPCGDPDVQLGKRFEPTAMQGEPRRAYLLLHGPIRNELASLLGQGSTDDLKQTLAQRIGAIRLLAVEADWTTLRVLEPEGVAAHADPVQQACFADPARGLGCCLGDGPRDRGCLPKADPPSVTISFRDGNEALKLRYPVGKGEVTIRRGRLVYWCLAWARATLAPR
jgi:hypothetical protein